MAYKIVNKKVVHISPPNNLTSYQSKRIASAKAPIKMLDALAKMKQQQFKINGRRIKISF